MVETANNHEKKRKILVVGNERNKITNALNSVGAFDGKSSDFEYVQTVKDARKRIQEVSYDPVAAPKYSLIAYDLSEINADAETKTQFELINKRVGGVPQMVFSGEKPTLNSYMKSVELLNSYGLKYFNVSDKSNIKNLKSELENIFLTPKHIDNLVVTKIGGSADDWKMQEKYKRNFRNLLCIIRDLHTGMYEGMPRIPSLITSGAGQRGLLAKANLEIESTNTRVRERFAESMKKSVAENLEDLLLWLEPLDTGIHVDEDLVKKYLNGESVDENVSDLIKYQMVNKITPEILGPNELYKINEEYLKNHIPLAGFVPYDLSVTEKIPSSDSDTHTVALADFFGAKRIILVKRTDAIYLFDPYRGADLNILKNPNSTEYEIRAAQDKWREVQRTNEQIKRISPDEINKISRYGSLENGVKDNETGHLIEDSAMEYFKRAKNVEEILVTHIDPDELYDLDGRHIVTNTSKSAKNSDKTNLVEFDLTNAYLNSNYISRISKKSA